MMMGPITVGGRTGGAAGGKGRTFQVLALQKNIGGISGPTILNFEFHHINFVLVFGIFQ